MAEYDSDSSGADDVETGVTLGYATKEPTGDDFSRLGGHPTWCDEKSPAPGNYAKCTVCKDFLSLLFQLHGDLPDQFAGHERRLYLFGCRRKTCRRRDGTIRGLRYTKIDLSQVSSPPPKQKQKQTPISDKTASEQPGNLGNTLFGAPKTSSGASTNPFEGTASVNSNPFGPSSAAATNPLSAGQSSTQPKGPSQQQDELSQTFADKARIAADETPAPASTTQGPVEPWPKASDFPEPYPSYFIDADKEFLDPEPTAVPQQARLDDFEESGGSGNILDDKSAFESAMDKAFQKFADRMTQNPEQVLRYEFGGQPLLYSKKDAVGKAWPNIPRCKKCGAQRKFELQLTPHAITELEANDISLEGMEWGTVMLAVCSNDCAGWAEEWVGVQWEEVSGNKP